MNEAYIKEINYVLPSKKLTNADYFELFPDEKDRKGLEQIGIEERGVVDNVTTASDLAVRAAEKLFNENKIDRNQIDFILFCAQEFDFYTPTTACAIHEKLDLPEECGALDFNLGCSGFVYGLSIAKGLINSGSAENVLFLTSSTLTKTFHKKDKSSKYVFGDGAAATLISSRKQNGIGMFELGTSGKGKNKIIIEHGGARNPITKKSFEEKKDQFGNISSLGNFYMDGPGIFLFSNRTVPKLVRQTLSKNELKMEDIDLFVFHQANEFLLKTLRKRINIPEEKFYIHLSKVGNTVSSSIPIALFHALEEGKIKKGDKVLLIAFGVGLSWGGTVLQV